LGNLENSTKTKTCRTCKIEKAVDLFGLRASNKDGLNIHCAECHRAHCRIRSAKYAKTPRGQAYARAYRAGEKSKESEKIREASDHRKACRNRRGRERRAADIQYKLQTNLRSRLYCAIRNGQKAGSAISDLGCSVEELKKHLESQFEPGMTWENWGHGSDKWNIDHIIPLSSVNLENREEFLKVVHFSNLRPLWMPENVRLGQKARLDLVQRSKIPKRPPSSVKKPALDPHLAAILPVLPHPECQ